MSDRSKVFDFVVDEDFRASLQSDYNEMERCLEASAWKAVHVLAGSIVEAILIDYLVDDGLIGEKEALTLDLGQAIAKTEKHGITSKRATQLSSVVQDYRNLIHPGRAKRLGDKVDQSTAEVARGVVFLIVEEVAGMRLQNYGFTADQIATKLIEDSSALAILAHLLKDVKEREVERLLLGVLPTRYLEYWEQWDELPSPGHVLDALSQCFRVALDGASDGLKQKVGQWFARLIREEGDRVVSSYVAAFLRSTDMEHMGANEQALVKDHLLSRMKNGVTAELLEAVERIVLYLDPRDADGFVGPLVRGACSASALAQKIEKYLAWEGLFNGSEELNEAILGRLNAWATGYRTRGQEEKAAIVDSLVAAFKSEDIPF